MADPPKPPRRTSQTGRPSQTVRSSQAARPSRDSTLREVISHAVDSEKEFKRKTVLSDGNPRERMMIVVMIGLLAFSAYSWIAKPAFIWGPAVQPLPPAEQEVNLRLAMFMLGMRVDAYRAREGVFPPSLEALGERARGISYSVLPDSGFQLRGRAAGREIVFNSIMTADEFLGSVKDQFPSARRR